MITNYDYYRIFYYVAKYKSFTKAARVLFNNQPNITRSVKNLEAALGCPLFIRTNRGVTLTPEGERLFVHISAAVEQIQAGELELSMEKELQSGALSIAVSETALHNLLLPVLSRYHQTYPGIRLKISNHSTPQAIDALKNGQADLAVVTTPIVIRSPFYETKLKAFREILVCGPSLASLQNQSISLADLSRFPLICLGRDTKTYEFYQQLFFINHAPFSPDIEVATTDQILSMVKHDLGIGFLSEAMAEAAVENGEIFPLKLKEEIPERSICLVRRTGRFLSPPAAELEKMLLRPLCDMQHIEKQKPGQSVIGDHRH